MDPSLWQIKREDILKVDTQRNEKTGKDFATVTFKHKGAEKYAFIKQLDIKPADMDLVDWCITVLNTHYIVRDEEKKRGKKIGIIQPVNY